MKKIAVIYCILILHVLNNQVFAQSLGDYCFKEYEGSVSMIRIQSDSKFEYFTLFSNHGYEEIKQKGIYQLNRESIKFIFTEEQFLNKDSLYTHLIEPYNLAGYISKNGIRIGEKESFLPYKKCKCSIYRRELKKWSKLQAKTK